MTRVRLKALGWTRPLRLMAGSPRREGWEYPEPVLDLGFREEGGRTVTVTLRQRDLRIVRLTGHPMPENPKATPTTLRFLDRAWRALADGRTYETPTWRTKGPTNTGMVDLKVDGRIFFNVNPMLAAMIHVDPSDGRVVLFIAAQPTPALDRSSPSVTNQRAIGIAMAQKTVEWRKPDWHPSGSATPGWFIQEGWARARPVIRVIVEWRQPQPGFKDPILVHQDTWIIDARTAAVLPAPHGVRT